MFRSIFALTALTVVSFAAPAAALEAEQRVLKQISVTQADGTEKTSYVDADLVTPGTTVVYALIFRNDQEAPANDIVLVMPVPAEVAYIEGSATNRLARTDFSADGGTTFAPRQSLSLTDVNGSVRAAGSEDITHVRWTVAEAVQPGETGQLWFRGILK